MRKFALISFAFAAAVLFFCIIQNIVIAAILAAIGIICGLILIPLKFKAKIVFMLVLLSFSAGLVWTAVYSQIYAEPAKEFAETIEGRCLFYVTDFSETTEYGTKITGKVEVENRKIKTVLYDYSDINYELRPGAVLEIDANFKYSDGSRLSKGIFLIATVNEGTEIVSEGKSFEFKYIHRYIANAAISTADALFSEKSSALVKAVILGDKTDIYADEEMSRAFSVTGVAHIIAVSGMHVSFLVSMVFTIIKRRRVAIPIVIVVMILFAGVTGFPASVVRAVVMQIFVLLAFYVRRETDSITFLSAALLLLLIVNPYSIMNIGLQLSFLATFGLIKFSPKLSEWLQSKLCTEKVKKSKGFSKIVDFVIGSLSASVSASIMTVPLTALYFGNLSLVAPIANLLILWAVSLMFSFGIFSLILGAIYLPIGYAVSLPAAVAAEYITNIIRYLGSLGVSVLYTENTYLRIWMALVYAAGILLIALKAKRKHIIIAVCIAALLLLAAISLPIIKNDIADINITALDVGQGQSVVITTDDLTAVIDCGGNRMESAGDTVADYLNTIGRTTVDILIFSHFDSDHTNGVDRLFDRLTVQTVLLPKVGVIAGENEETIYTLAKAEGSDIIYVKEDLTVNFGDARMLVIAEASVGKDDNNNSLIVHCSKNDFDMLVMGDADKTVEEQLC